MHEIFLKRAIDLAHKGKYLTKPNPMVGCVIVKDNEVIAEGHHMKYGSCLLYTSPSPRDLGKSRMPSSA